MAVDDSVMPRSTVFWDFLMSRVPTTIFDWLTAWQSTQKEPGG
jgi:hypothetical protein